MIMKKKNAEQFTGIISSPKFVCGFTYLQISLALKQSAHEQCEFEFCSTQSELGVLFKAFFRCASDTNLSGEHGVLEPLHLVKKVSGM